MLIVIANWDDLQQFLIAQWYSFRLPLWSPGFKSRSMLSNTFLLFGLNFFLNILSKNKRKKETNTSRDGL